MTELVGDEWEQEAYWATRHFVLAGGFAAGALLGVVSQIRELDYYEPGSAKAPYSERTIARWAKLACMSQLDFAKEIARLRDNGLIKTQVVDIVHDKGLRVWLTEEGRDACYTFKQ